LIKNGIKVTHKKGGDRRIDPVRNVLKELVTIRVAIRCIETTNTKRLAIKKKRTLQKAAICIRPRVHKGQ